MVHFYILHKGIDCKMYYDVLKENAQRHEQLL